MAGKSACKRARTKEKDGERARTEPQTEGMPNEPDISRGSNHFRGDRLWIVAGKRAARGEIVIQLRGGTVKFEFKAGRMAGDQHQGPPSPSPSPN